MYLLTIILKQTPQLLQFHFKQFKDADEVLKRSSAAGAPLALRIDDDYGSVALVVMGDISGIFITDLDKEMAAHEVVDLAKLRKDLRVQKKRMEDPALRLMIPSQGVA